MTELHAKMGKLLKLERERAGLGLNEVSEKIKISLENLQHIENGNHTALPSELYYNLFAKSYAEFLGIDYAATVEAIKEDVGQPLEEFNNRKPREAVSAVEGTPIERDESSESSAGSDRRLVRTFLYLVGGVVVLFIIFVVVNELFLGNRHQRSARDAAGPGGEQSSETEPVPGTVTSDLTSFDWNVPEYKPPEPLELRLLARDSSWAMVLADGDTAIYRILTPGRQYEVSASYRLQVSVGVPQVVSVDLNGLPVDLRDPESGRISRVNIDQLNVQTYLNPPVDVDSNPAPPAGKG